MKPRIFFISTLLLIMILISFSSCEKTVLDEPSKKKKDVFESFWTGVDERYSYFELKNIDWDAVHEHYSKTITEEMSDEAFFDTLSVLIDILQDGHSGMKSPFNLHKNVGFYTRGPENVNDRLIVDNYSKGWGMVKGSLHHFPLCNKQVGYVSYSSFEEPITDEDIDYIVNKYQDTKGLIIDIRNNYGGAAENIFKLVKRFINTETYLFSTRFKNGPAHNDFTEMNKTIVSPAQTTYKGKVCVLTNRKVYSAASIFSLAMHEAPNVTIVGDTTGGGLGLPVGFELPNEWQVHCAGSQIFSVSGENFELGVPPDVQIDMKKEDEDKGIDSIIEKAIEIILE